MKKVKRKTLKAVAKRQKKLSIKEEEMMNKEKKAGQHIKGLEKLSKLKGGIGGLWIEGGRV